MNILHHYNEDHNTKSAKIVIPIIKEFLEINSVVDVGCGPGQWLFAFEEKGINLVLGIDGPHVTNEQLLINPTKFQVVDLNDCKNISVSQKFDLCLCLEVAEHISPENGEQLIKFLTSLSDNILFSAAIPNQTGENHLNEQWADYWIELFSYFGYKFLDVIRDKIWNDNQVNWWYRQNMFLVTKNNSLIEKYSQSGFKLMPIIHPKLLELYTQENNALKNAIETFGKQRINKSNLLNRIKNRF